MGGCNAGSLLVSVGGTAFLGDSFSDTAHLTGGTKAIETFGGEKWLLGCMYVIGWGQALGVPYLHEEEFQVLAGHGPLRRGEVELPPGSATTSEAVGVGAIRLCVPGHAGPGQGGNTPTPAGLTTRLLGFGQASTSLLPPLPPSLVTHILQGYTS